MFGLGLRSARKATFLEVTASPRIFEKNEIWLSALAVANAMWFTLWIFQSEDSDRRKRIDCFAITRASPKMFPEMSFRQFPFVYSSSRTFYANANRHFRHALSSQTSFICNQEVRFQPIYSKSVLSSASLLCNYLRSWHVRNFETNSAANNRKIMSLSGKKNFVWSCLTLQESRIEQIREVIRSTENEIRSVRLRLKCRPDDAKLKATYSQLNEEREKGLLIAGLIEPKVLSSIHPAESHNPEHRKILGISLRLAGPRRGNRAVVHRAAAGSVSTSSIGLVYHEEAHAQIPGRMGTYGLTVKIVYGHSKDLASHGLSCWSGKVEYSPFAMKC